MRRAGSGRALRSFKWAGFGGQRRAAGERRNKDHAQLWVQQPAVRWDWRQAPWELGQGKEPPVGHGEE